MNKQPKSLFSDHTLSALLRGELEKAHEEIDRIPEEQFLASNNEEVINHIYSKMQIMPIELHEEEKQLDFEETKVDVRNDQNRGILDKRKPFLIPGFKATISIPFEGLTSLWYCRPSSYYSSSPRANIHESGRKDGVGYGHVNIVVSVPSDTLDEKEINQHVERTLSNIRSCLNDVKKDVEAHNLKLLSHIKQYAALRREWLGKHAAIAKALNIPLKKKSGTPDISALPIKKRLVRPLPSPSKKPPEPGIRDEDFKLILQFIRFTGRSFEKSPQTYLKHNEEELRDIILANLNSIYEGLATGETFSRSGKTDIHIEDKNRAAFIAECKIWRGKSGLHDAIDQLLGYLTWRDCKTALVIFNFYNAGFTELQTKLSSELEEHSNVQNRINNQEPGEWRFKVQSKDDEERFIILHVFLFNLYVAPEERK